MNLTANRQYNFLVQSPPANYTGLDSFDMYRGGHVPAYPEDIANNVGGKVIPRAALKMHLQLGSNASFLDGHVELIKPPGRPANAKQKEIDAIYQFYLKKFGVQNPVLNNITTRDGPGASKCAVGDPNFTF